MWSTKMANALGASVRKHLEEVIHKPQTPLDKGLLERLHGHTVGGLSHEDRISLVNLVAELLQKIQQDPTPVTRLAELLVEGFSFGDVLDIKPSVDLVAGLKVPSPPVQLLTLRLLSLAAHRVGDVGIIAGSPDLVRALVDLWLRTADIAVADSSRNVISALLLTELESNTATTISYEEYQQGLMQRRVFKDKNVYNLFFSIPSLKTLGQPGQPSRRDKTIAQGRLFDLIKDIWRLPDIWQSQIPEIEKAYGISSGGLASFAALHMIDPTDVILRVTQINLFTDLIQMTYGKQSMVEPRSKLLEFLTSTSIHEGVISLYTSPDQHDPLDITFLYAPAAKYLAAYSQTYYEHFIADTSTCSKVLKRLHEVLDAVPNSQWARNDGPAHDLHVLVSVPRLAVVTNSSIVLQLPTKPPSADVFHTLATLFHGGLESIEPANIQTLPAPTSTSSPPWQQTEQWAARLLYLTYITTHPSFWPSLVSASSLSAFKDTAIAAIDLMVSLVTAQWSTEPGPTYSVPIPSPDSSPAISDGWYGSEPPANGLAAVLHPQVLDVLLPFVMSETGNSGVGLLGADPGSAAYHVARAKLRLAAKLREGIEEMVRHLPEGQEERGMLTELAAGLGALVRQGVGRRGQEPGVEVAAMEL